MGLIIGYAVHRPAIIEQIKYVNVTTVSTETPAIEETIIPATLTPIVTLTVTPIVTLTVTPIVTPPAPTAMQTPTPSDFMVKRYDPATDKPTRTIELKNYRANPDTLSIYLSDSVLIELIDTSLQNPVTLIFNSTVMENLGTSGKRLVTFNKKGTYTYRAIISQSDPAIIPGEYATGTIIVN
ncbi:MAG: hypothetical protein J5U16_00435 [Candidatus Methanoperedens sp.]|nr:hypothetical protein [Candidatus Methanoperedens sp.]